MSRLSGVFSQLANVVDGVRLGQITQLADERARPRADGACRAARQSGSSLRESVTLFVFQQLLRELVIVGNRKPRQVFSAARLISCRLTASASLRRRLALSSVGFSWPPSFCRIRPGTAASAGFALPSDAAAAGAAAGGGDAGATGFGSSAGSSVPSGSACPRVFPALLWQMRLRARRDTASAASLPHGAGVPMALRLGQCWWFRQRDAYRSLATTAWVDLRFPWSSTLAKNGPNPARDAGTAQKVRHHLPDGFASYKTRYIAALIGISTRPWLPGRAPKRTVRIPSATCFISACTCTSVLPCANRSPACRLRLCRTVTGQHQIAHARKPGQRQWVAAEPHAERVISASPRVIAAARVFDQSPDRRPFHGQSR